MSKWALRITPGDAEREGADHLVHFATRREAEQSARRRVDAWIDRHPLRKARRDRDWERFTRRDVLVYRLFDHAGDLAGFVIVRRVGRT